MSLATRCPACHTVFRIVQDQLRVSEGWVRCGQCQEVFNALETLFDLGDVASPAPSSAAEAPDVHAHVEDGAAADSNVAPIAGGMPSVSHAGELVAEESLPSEHWGTWLSTAPKNLPTPADESAFDDMQEPRESAPTEQTRPPDTASVPDLAVITHEPTPSQFIGPSPDWARKSTRSRRGPKSSHSSSTHVVTAAGASGADSAHALVHDSRGARRRRRKPEFVREAERAAFWRRPAVRALLGSATILLGSMGVLQVVYQFRDPLAAQLPAMAPALRAACAWAGCQIQPPRAIDHIRLDASDLVRTDQDRVLRFTADIHNTAVYAVLAPALDVSFTDPVGHLVARRIFQPGELGLQTGSIEADAQWRIDTRLAVGELNVAGYTVEVFYP